MLVAPSDVPLSDSTLLEWSVATPITLYKSLLLNRVDFTSLIGFRFCSPPSSTINSSVSAISSVISVNSDRSKLIPVAVVSNPAPTVISVRSNVTLGVIVTGKQTSLLN